MMTLLSSGERLAHVTFIKLAVVFRLHFMNVIEFCVGMYIMFFVTYTNGLPQFIELLHSRACLVTPVLF